MDVRAYLKAPVLLAAMVLLSCAPLFADDVKVQSLSEKASACGDLSVRKHLTLADGYMKKAMLNNYLKELDILILIDAGSADYYKKFKADAQGPASVFSISPAGLTVSAKSQELFVQAVTAYRNSDLDAARQILNRIILADPGDAASQSFLDGINSEPFTYSQGEMFTDSAKAFYDKGMVYYRKGLYQQALVEFNQAYGVDPVNAQVLKFRALSAGGGQTSTATVSEKFLMTGDALDKEKNTDDARAAYDNALKADPSNARAIAAIKNYDAKCAALVTQAKNLLANDRAMDAYLTAVMALEYSPANAEAIKTEAAVKNAITGKRAADMLYNRGADYYTGGDYDSAIETWNRVLSIFPDDAQTKDAIKKAQAKLDAQKAGNTAKAAASLKKGTDYMNQGLLDKAIGMFEYVLRLDPENTAASDGLKKIKLEQGEAVYDSQAVDKKQ